MRYSLHELIRQFRTGIPRGQLNRLAEQTPINSAVTLSVVILVLVFVTLQVSEPLMYIWAAAQAGLILLVFLRWRKLSHRSQTNTNKSMILTRSGLRHSVIWAALSGGLWGSLIAFLPDQPPHIQLALILTMGGMAAGASTTLAAVPQVAIVFILGCGLPVTFYHLAMGGQAGMLLALVFAIFTAAMLGTSRVVYLATLKQLRAEEKTRVLQEAGLQQRVATLVNEAKTLDEALQSCLAEICEYTGWVAGHVYLLATDGSNQLVSSGVWHDKDEARFRALRQLTLESRFGPGEGFPGRVLERREPVWKSDSLVPDDIPGTPAELIVSGEFPRAELILRENIRAIFGFPIFVGPKVVAVAEFLSDVSDRPAEQIMDALATVASMLGRAIERHHSEAGLRQSEEKFRTLMESSAQGIAVHLNGKFLYINKEGARNFGYTVGEILAMDSVFDLVHPDYHEIMTERAAARLTGEPVPEAYEFDGLHKDGRTITLYSRSSTIEWQGETALLMTSVDVTEQKRAEAQYRLLLDSTAEAIYGIDLEGNCTFVNPACLAMLGYQDQSELLGKNMHALMHHTRPDGTEYPTKECRIYVAFHEGKGVHVDDEVLWRADGSSFPAEYWSHPIVKNGEVLGSVVTFLDITERKAIENALRDSRTSMENAQRITHVGNFEWNITNGDLYWSAELYRIYGLDPATFVPTEEKIMKFNHPDDYKKVMDATRRAIREDSPSDVSRRLVRPSGEIRFVRTLGEITRDPVSNDQIMRGTVQDITDQRRTEGQLQQAQKMEAVGQLTSGIAHDFNNMLSVVMGNLEMAADAGVTGEDFQKHLSAAMRGAQRGADLNRQLLTFSRQQVLEEKVTDVNEIISGMSGLLERALGEQVKITTVLSEEDCVSKLDPAQLESAILNLSINARDALPGGGKLKIETQVLGGEKDMIRISVSDNGSGMTAEIKERAIEPFFTTKEVGAGSGLGLSMVYGFAAQNGGSMEIESRPGKGTTVHLLFPVCGEGEKEADLSALGEMPRAANGEVLLVVEDQRDVRDVIVSYLGDLGYEVLEAEDGNKAIKILETFKSIDLILSDMVLPGGLGGDEVVRRAKAILPDLKSLYMSGNPLRSNGGSGDSHGPILRKPFRKAELAQAVRNSLDAS